MAITVDKIKDAIENSAICLSEIHSVPDRLRTILGVFGEKKDQISAKDDLRVCRIASLTLVNALIFQEILSSNESSVKTLRRTLEEASLVDAFSEIWKHILFDIDYIPIFKVAREILLELPSGPQTDKAIQFLGKVALETTGNRAALKHDLMGRIYHKLLVDAKYFGAFYTTIPAATLLLELTFDPKYWELEFSDEKKLRLLKIADLACGTGTLLKAALEAVVDDHIKAVTGSGNYPKIVDIHKVFLEDSLYGYDVLPFAVHLAASTLALHEPDASFRRMNLFFLPLGGPDSKLGSLDFLPKKVAYVHMQKDLFGATTTGGSQITGYGDETVSVKIPKLDLCVMNPPFTRSVGGNLLFGAYPADQRKKMQNRLKRIIAKDKVRANITAGLGSVFVALADKYLKKTGHLALVLPKSLLSGEAWEETRKLLMQKYRVRYIVVSHETGSWNFSENTELSECMLVADGKGNKNTPDTCIVVNLTSKPKSNVEALTLASLILTASAPHLEDSGVFELSQGKKKYGEIISIPSDKSKLWSYCTAFAQTELVRVAVNLAKGSLYLPTAGVVDKIPMAKLCSIFNLGPDRRDIHDGFKQSFSETTYPAVWGHDSNQITTIMQSNNQFLLPLAKPQQGRNLRNPILLWGRSGRLLIAERMWLTTHRLFSIWCQNNVLSNVWWTLRANPNLHNKIPDLDLEKTISLWLNSTLGVIQLLRARTETRGPWIGFKKPNLDSLRILDPTALSENQIREFVQLFESIKSEQFLPLPKISIDKTRQFLDTEISRILNVADYGALRDLLGNEPVFALQDYKNPLGQERESLL